MGIVKIEKDFKSNVNSSDSYKKQQDILPGSSLTSLNNSNNEYSFDFNNNSAGMNNGRIKNEIGIVPACVKTVLNSILKITILLGIVYLIYKYLNIDIDLTCFEGNEYLTKDVYWDEFKKVGIIFGASLVILCFISKLFINGAIKKVLKKNYLSKLNTYIYDGFITIYNIFYYVVISFGYFRYINNIFDRLESLNETGKIVEGVNIELFGLFKYAVVVVIAVFITLNVLRGVSIVYKKNRFVFEEQL